MPLAFVEYDADTGEPLRDEHGRVRKVQTGEPGLLLSPRSADFQPFDGYTDKEASEKKLVRDAFKKGDVWFNTGDLMSSQGMRPRRVHRPARRHVPVEGRERRDHRGRGRAVDRPAGRGVHGVRRRGARHRRPGRHGRDQAAGGRRSSTARRWRRPSTTSCPATRVPLFVRVVESLAHTSTFKSQQGRPAQAGLRHADVEDPLYVLAGRDEGYVRVLRRVPRRGRRTASVPRAERPR